MRYRIVAMLPTEMYVDGDSVEAATNTVSWLTSEYPGVEYPVSDSPTNTDTRTAMPKVLSVEESSEEEYIDDSA